MMKELERIAKAKKKLESFIKEDCIEEASDAIAELLSAQAQSDIEDVEICVPTKSVMSEVDLGAVSLKETTYGILFTAKGSMQTLIKWSQKELCDELRFFMEQMNKDFSDFNEDDKANMETYAQAWLCVLQAPLFCHLDPECTVDVATTLVNTLHKKASEYLNASLKQESPEDEQFAESLSAVESPKPKVQSKRNKKK